MRASWILVYFLVTFHTACILAHVTDICVPAHVDHLIWWFTKWAISGLRMPAYTFHTNPQKWYTTYMPEQWFGVKGA